MEKQVKNVSTFSIKTQKESATGAVVENGTKAIVLDSTKAAEMLQKHNETQATAEVVNSENTPKMEVVTVPSIEELQAKAEKTAKLVNRYQTIKAKKAEVDSFVILHESEQAQITITDVTGRSIRTNNPHSIEQVLKIWKEDISAALKKAEAEIREIMNAQQAMPEALKLAA